MTTFVELSEQEATGELAQIYAEIRQTYGAPYVSSLQRHFATYPGVLEWAWGIVAPGFHSGLVQRTASRIAQETNREQALAKLSVEALRDIGVDADGEKAIRNICANFVRVAPLNLLFAGCIRALLEGASSPSGSLDDDGSWTAPEPLSQLPGLCDVAQLAPQQAASIGALSTHMGDQVFVPGLYRMLAHWPGYLDYSASLIGPCLADAGFRQRGEFIAQQINDAVPNMLLALPTPPDLPMPDAQLTPALLEAIATYRRTSPEMVQVGSLLLGALPGAA